MSRRGCNSKFDNGFCVGFLQILRQQNELEKREIISLLDQILSKHETEELPLANIASKNTYVTELCKFEQQINHKLTEITYGLKKFIALKKPPIYKSVVCKKDSDVDLVDIEVLKANSVQISMKLEEYSFRDKENVGVRYPYVSKNTLEKLSDHTKDMLRELSVYDEAAVDCSKCGHSSNLENEFPALIRSCCQSSISSDISNNVFEHFPIPEHQQKCWKRLPSENINSNVKIEDSHQEPKFESEEVNRTEESLLCGTLMDLQNGDKSEYDKENSSLFNQSICPEKQVDIANDFENILKPEENCLKSSKISQTSSSPQTSKCDVQNRNNFTVEHTNIDSYCNSDKILIGNPKEQHFNSLEYYSEEDDIFFDSNETLETNSTKLIDIQIKTEGEKLQQTLNSHVQECIQTNNSSSVDILMDFKETSNTLSGTVHEENLLKMDHEIVESDNMKNEIIKEKLSEISSSGYSKLNNELCASENDDSSSLTEFETEYETPLMTKKKKVHWNLSKRSGTLEDSTRLRNNLEDEKQVLNSVSDKYSKQNIVTNNDSSQDSVKDCNLNANTSAYSAEEKILSLGLMDRWTKFEQTRKIAVLPDLRLQPSVTDNEKIKQIQNEKMKQSENKFEIASRPIPHLYATCVFSHIESPFEFYIHLDNEESKLLDNLNDLITQSFKHTKTPFRSKFEAFNKIGRFCCAYVRDDKTYYRAEIIDWFIEDETKVILIQLVDYGNLTVVHYKHLRELTREFCIIPKIAIKCYLPMLYPPGSTKLKQLAEWPTSSIEALRELSGLCHVGEKFFKIFYVQNEEAITGIDLYKVGDDELSSIGQLLIDLGHATQIILPEDDPFGIAFEDEEIKRMEECNTINEVVLGYDPRDEARICKFVREDGTCFKGKNCKFEHERFARGGFTTDQQLTYACAINDLILPKEAQQINIRFTMFVGASHYYINLMNFADSLKIMESMMNNERNCSTFVPYKIMPAYGEIVLVKHWTKRWMRARVRHHSYDDEGNCIEVQVFMVDYGDVIDVPLKSVRHIQPEYLELPFQAVECILYNYKSKNNLNLKEMDTFFFENMVFRKFSAQVMGVSDMLLCLKVFHKDQDLGEILTERGFLTRVNNVCFPSNGAIVIPG
ncbi:hypothetical protein HHI36_015267 [Cryptolaemus montrouzieri]|uniref:Tudor domain-containing protein 1 n=1 Tax=Cryptolaemus montrouzieri TaxID=559131 RepID=A0ABD2N552_9CUCU